MAFLVLLILLHWFACSGHCFRSLREQIRQAVASWRFALLALAIRLHLHGQPRRYWRIAATATGEEARAICRARAKPEWVKQEVLRLKALMPHDGCRKVSDCFNRRLEESRKTTVGKTYVSNMIRQHRYEVQVLRKQIKNAKPKAVPKNLIWAFDLTGKSTLDGQTQMILGIIEHASRAALTLEAVHSKSSWTLVGQLVAATNVMENPTSSRQTMKQYLLRVCLDSHCFCWASAIKLPICIAPGRTAGWSGSSGR